MRLVKLDSPFTERMMASKGIQTSEVIADVLDSLMKIPGVRQRVNYIEHMMSLGHERNVARRRAEGAHLSMAMADSVDYYALVDAVSDVVADTTVPAADLYSSVASIAADAAASFPEDTDFVAWSAQATDTPNWIRDAVEYAEEYEWRWNNWDGSPQFSLSSDGCELYTGIPGNTTAFPGWIWSKAKEIGFHVIGRIVLTARSPRAVLTAAGEGAIDGIYVAGVTTIVETYYQGLVMLAHAMAGFDAALRTAYVTGGHIMLRAPTDSVGLSSQ